MATGVSAQLAALVGELHNRAFRRLWLSQVVSEFGDWAARLALTTVVYRRTDSAAWAALIAVSSMLPMLGGGQLLASLADRVDRRIVMVVADLVRAALFVVLAIATPPTPILFALSVAAGLATVPFEAARSAATLDVTPEERIPAVMSLGQATQSVALIGGWSVGGGLLALMGAHGALAVNAGTFVLSALLLVGLPALRPLASPAASADRAGRAVSPDAAESAIGRLAAASRSILREPLVRRAGLLAVFAVGPATAVEALVVPYVGQTWSNHQSIAAVLLALGAAGDLVVTVAIPTRFRPERLLRIAALCAAAPAAVAILLLSSGSAALVGAGFVVSALSLAAIAPASAALAPRLPTHLRASCFTVLATALTLTQVVLSTGGGLAADAASCADAARLLMWLPLAAGVGALARPVIRRVRVAEQAA
ncbi:MAG TPA: MFS transporter [Mycobacteriales bacterium]|nr:MFS transporter [Mycobacteriales bacterium]